MSYLLIILSAFLLNIPNYFPGFYLLAWFSFLPLFYVLEQSLNTSKKIRLSSKKKDIFSIFFDLEKQISNNRLFFKGWVFGLFYTAFSAYFIYNSIYLYTGFNILLISLLLFAVFALLSLFYAAFFKIYFSFFKEIKPLYFSAAWLIFTFFRYKVLHFFPIGYLAVGQAEFLTFIQLADFGGIWILTFLLLFFNTLLYKIIFKKGQNYKYITSVFLIIILIFSYGQYSLFKYQPSAAQIKANNQQSSTALSGEETFITSFLARFIEAESNEEAELGIVTTDILQKTKWYNKNVNQNINTTLSAAEQLTESRIIFTPETNITIDITTDQRREDFFELTAENIDVPLQVGSMALGEDRQNKYNSSFLISDSGKIMQRYNKNRLVYFGEVYPFEDLLTKLTFNFYSFSSLDAGDEITIFEAEGLKWKTLICSEIFYTDYAVKKTEDAYFIVNQTNEGWYRNDIALRNLMWNNAVLRAVETRRSILKPGNIADDGLIYSSGQFLKTSGTKNYHNLRVSLNDEITFYSRFYNYIELFLYILTFVLIGLFLIKLLR